MPPRSKTVCLFLLVVISHGAGAQTQVRDSTTAVPAVRSIDSVMTRDSTAAEDSLRVSPLRSPGSLNSGGLQSAKLADSTLEFVPFRTAGDILHRFGGIFVSETGVGGVRRKFSVHGLADGSIAFLADGLLLNDPSNGLYLAEGYPVDFAGGVELAPSPGGFAAAPGAAGGALNFVSHSPRAPRPVSRLRYTQSSYNWSDLDASLSQDVAKDFNVALGLHHQSSDGRFENSAQEAWIARLKVRYDLDGAAFYASDIFTRSERGLFDGVSLSTPESLLYEPVRAIVVNPSATEHLTRHDANAGVAIGTDGGNLTTLDLQYNSVYREYRDELGGGSTGTPFRDTREEQTYGFKLIHSHRIAGTRLSLGLDLLNRRLLRDPNIGAHGSTLTGISGTMPIAIGTAFSIVSSARYDRYLDQARVSLGADLRLTVADVFTLRGGFSRSHRHPSFAEAFGVGSLALALPTADPERHDILSGGFIAGDSGAIFASVTVFHREVYDAVILVSSGAPTGPPLAYARSGKEIRTGVSTAAGLRIGPFLAEFTGDYLSYGKNTWRRYAPEWNLSGGIYLRDRMIDGHLDLKAGFRGRYFSIYSGEGYLQRYELFTPTGYDIPSAESVDFVFYAGIGDAVIHFIWENLLDREYTMLVLYPMDDRSFRFGVTWNFLN